MIYLFLEFFFIYDFINWILSWFFDWYILQGVFVFGYEYLILLLVFKEWVDVEDFVLEK